MGDMYRCCKRYAQAGIRFQLCESFWQCVCSFFVEEVEASLQASARQMMHHEKTNSHWWRVLCAAAA